MAATDYRGRGCEKQEMIKTMEVFMKKIVIVAALMFAVISAYAADTQAKGPDINATATAAVVAPGMEQLAAKVSVTNIKGALVPQVDRDVFKYFTAANFVYNRDRTEAIMIFQVKQDDAAKVKGILSKKNSIVDTSNPDQIEKDYRGFKKRFKKPAGN
jgi:hypothetical protein